MPARTTLAAALALVVLVLPPDARPRSLVLAVGSEGELQAALSALRDTGGTIMLRPGDYSSLVVPPRSSRPLRITGTRGVRVGQILFDRTQHVSLGGMTVVPFMEDALVEVRTSTAIDLHDLVVTAQGTPYSSSGAAPGRARRHDPEEQVHALRRPARRLRQLRAPVPVVEARHHRGELVPRLLRVRLHSRPLRLRPDDPAQPARARASVPHQLQPLPPPGPGRALRGTTASDRGQSLRRLPARRSAALPHECRRPRDDREQRLRRNGSPSARLRRARRADRRKP